MNTQETETNPKGNRKKWLKRLGIFGFLFFLIKGLAWIAVAIAAWYGFKLF